MLGLGAPGRAFRDKSFELPGGRIGWIRWMDRDWLAGVSRPTLSFEVPPDDPVDPFAEELTDEWLDYCADAGRFVLSIEDPSPWETRQEAANVAADVAAGLLAFAVPVSQELSAVRLEADWVERGRVLLQDIQERDAGTWEPPWLSVELSSIVGLPRAQLTQIISRVGPAMADGEPTQWGVVPALAYHQLALGKFAFAPDDVRQIMEDQQAGPDRPFERARAEESFHNTWKAIEAALGGELNANDRRFAERLRERGLDAEGVPRFPDGERRTLQQRLRRLGRVRDRQSAHGGRAGVTRRVVTYFDLVEGQWMAAEVVLGILDAAGQAP